MATTSENLIRDFFDCWHRFDLEGALSRISDDCRFRPDPNADEVAGREAIRAKWGKYMELMRSYDCEYGPMAQAGNVVFCERLEIVGSSRGYEMRVPIVGVFELDESGKITAWRDYYDTASAPSVEGA